MATVGQILFGAAVIGGIVLLAPIVFEKKYRVEGKLGGRPIYFESYSLKDSIEQLYNLSIITNIQSGDNAIIINDDSLELEFVARHGKLVVDRVGFGSQLQNLNNFNLGNVQGYIND